MKNKGFTLIELLAVIVILAVIALIAVPIVVELIDNSTIETEERSMELYATAVKNAIATYQLIENKLPTSFDELQIDYTSGEIECEEKNLYSNGDFYLKNCIINDGDNKYSYNTMNFTCKLNDKDNNGVASLSDVVTCGTESFYVMENKNNEITMLSLYNLNIGTNAYTEGTIGIQNENVVGYKKGYTTYGTVAFSTTNYWQNGNYTPAGDSSYQYVYDSNSNLYQYVSAYETYLKENGVSSAKATIISYEQATDIMYQSVFDSTSYWTGSAGDSGKVWHVDSFGFSGPDGIIDMSGLGASGNGFVKKNTYGVRPVVTISTSEIQ